ncbi:MAG: tRNA pseudouridine(38-40) synthase TruA [Lachnospiraceae bacterium]|nr:tRNA pseudouridine(38-40) synthase TruA [Lachnospiraceae bacterium]
MQKNYKMILGYDGSRYSGWEHKTGRDTIQGKLVQVLGHLTDEPVHIIGAGRTDAGVHAKGMVANVVLDTELSDMELKDYVNHYLPEDIVVYEMTEVPERFHARYNAIGKTYQYRIYDGRQKPLFDRKYVWTTEKKTDVERMREGATYLQGTHDFAAFCKNPQKKKSTVRTVDRIEIERDNDYVTLTFHGDGFLYHMVRIMTGTLVQVGLGRMEPSQIAKALATGERTLAGVTAPSQGLTLVQIDYPAR